MPRVLDGRSTVLRSCVPAILTASLACSCLGRSQAALAALHWGLAPSLTTGWLAEPHAVEPDESGPQYHNVCGVRRAQPSPSGGWGVGGPQSSSLPTRAARHTCCAAGACLSRPLQCMPCAAPAPSCAGAHQHASAATLTMCCRALLSPCLQTRPSSCPLPAILPLTRRRSSRHGGTAPMLVPLLPPLPAGAAAAGRRPCLAGLSGLAELRQLSHKRRYHGRSCF